MIADHLGQSYVHSWTLYCSLLSAFVFLPSPKTKASVNFWRIDASSGRRTFTHQPVLHKPSGRRSLSNVTSLKYVTDSWEGETQGWQLVDSKHSSNTACCQRIRHVLTALSIFKRGRLVRGVGAKTVTEAGVTESSGLAAMENRKVFVILLHTNLSSEETRLKKNCSYRKGVMYHCLVTVPNHHLLLLKEPFRVWYWYTFATDPSPTCLSVLWLVWSCFCWWCTAGW